MNDIYGAFANAYKSGDIQIKADPKRVFNLFNEKPSTTNSTRGGSDLENGTPQSTQGSNSLSQSFDSLKGKLFGGSD